MRRTARLTSEFQTGRNIARIINKNPTIKISSKLTQQQKRTEYTYFRIRRTMLPIDEILLLHSVNARDDDDFVVSHLIWIYRMHSSAHTISGV